jgi:ferredoxin
MLQVLRPRPTTGHASRSTSNISLPRAAANQKGGFTVELARSGVEYLIPEGETISTCFDAGIDVDYSCELGICGACEQRVISGTPEHRDSILSEEEQAETSG